MTDSAKATKTSFPASSSSMVDGDPEIFLDELFGTPIIMLVVAVVDVFVVV